MNIKSRLEKLENRFLEDGEVKINVEDISDEEAARSDEELLKDHIAKHGKNPPHLCIVRPEEDGGSKWLI